MFSHMYQKSDGTNIIKENICIYDQVMLYID